MTAFLLFCFVVFCFSFVLLFGAPYLPTKRSQTKVALDLLDLKQGKLLYELGCGDGTVMISAYKRGINCVGYELNPILYIVARVRTFRYRKNIKVIYGSFWKANISEADGVYVFLLDKFMRRLDKKLSEELKTGTKVISYTFKIPGKNVVEENRAMYLYKY